MIDAPDIQSMPAEDLVFRIQDGCDFAFSELVRRYQLDVRMYLARKLGNASSADDLAQEVFWTAYEKLPQLSDPRRVRGWLLSIARHKAIDQLRSQLRQPQTASDHLERLIAREQLRRGLQQDDSDSLDLQQALRECLAKLQPNSHQLVQQFYFERQSAEEIAAANRRKAGSVRMALLRIRQALARCIRAQTAGDPS